jgi:ribosomal protein L13
VSGYVERKFLFYTPEQIKENYVVLNADKVTVSGNKETKIILP